MNRLKFPAAAFISFGVFALSACGGDADLAEAAAEGSGAEGKVEGGSISDAMLPLDAVTSKAPSRGGVDEEEDESDDATEETGTEETGTEGGAGE